MRAYNIAFMKMIRALLSFFETNAEKIKDNKIILDVLDLVKQLAVTIIRYRKVQETDITGITTAKRNAKRLLAKATFVISGAIRTFAFDNKNDELFKKVKKSESAIASMGNTKMLDHVNIVKDEAIDNFEALQPYGLTQEKLDNLDKLLEEYTVLMPKPREAAANKANATKQMKSKIAELRTLIKDKLNNAMIEYSATDTKFYDGYERITEIIGPLTHHHDLWGFASDEETKLAIQNAKLELFKAGADLANTVKMTSKTGFYGYDGLEPGKYLLKITFEDYDPLEVDIYFYENQSKRFDFALRKTE